MLCNAELTFDDEELSFKDELVFEGVELLYLFVTVAVFVLLEVLV